MIKLAAANLFEKSLAWPDAIYRMGAAEEKRMAATSFAVIGDFFQRLSLVQTDKVSDSFASKTMSELNVLSTLRQLRR